MGMFDDVICEYPLPDPVLPFVVPGLRFQTKDLDCRLETYTIASDGRLLKDGELCDISDTVTFYRSNARACGYGQRFTRDGEDYQSVEYRATFADGHLTAIVEVSSEQTPALPVSVMPNRDTEIDCGQLPEPVVGATLFVAWGGGPVDRGYPVTVVAEDPTQLSCKTADGELELLHKFSFGSTLFLNRDQAESVVTARQAEWNAGTAEMARMLEEKSKPQ